MENNTAFNQYPTKNRVLIADLEVGHKYWVVNGHWEFWVKGRAMDGFVISICAFPKEIHIMRFDNEDRYSLKKIKGKRKKFKTNYYDIF